MDKNHGKVFSFHQVSPAIAPSLEIFNNITTYILYNIIILFSNTLHRHTSVVVQSTKGQMCYLIYT